MATPIVSPLASQDINEIAAYPKEEAGAEIANQVKNNIARTIDQILLFPNQGRVVQREPEIRRRPCADNARSYLMYLARGWQ